MRTVSPIGCRPGMNRRTKASLTMATGGLPRRSPSSKSRPPRRGIPIAANQPGVVASRQSDGRPRTTAGWRPFADGDHAAAPPAARQTSHRRDGRRSHAGHRRRGSTHTLDTSGSRLDRLAGGLQVQLHDEQRFGHEAERESIEGRERAQEESCRDDEDERHRELRDDERAACRETTVAGDRASGVLQGLTGRHALQSEHRVRCRRRAPTGTPALP